MTAAMIEDPRLSGPDATTPATEPESSASYQRNGRRPTKKAAPRSSKPRPSHYRVICISMYTQDLEDLDGKVRELKKRGKTKMSKSELIRLALANLNIDEVA